MSVWNSTSNAYSSREELEASGILDKWAQQQQQQQQINLPPTNHVSIQLCSHCQGHRIEKVLYNSMVLERNCTKCDGEGVIRPKETPQQQKT